MPTCVKCKKIDSGSVMHKENGNWVHNTTWLCENSLTAHSKKG